MADIYTAHSESLPYVVFRVKDSIFSINGQDIQSIQELPEQVTAFPHAPAYVRGSVKDLGQVISVVDLRSLFGWPTVGQEYQEFSGMIDTRKQEHLTWVDTLRRCYQEHTPFPLATDSHKCKLGMWLDHYQAQSPVIAHHFSQISEPHKTLHELAHTVLSGDGGQEGCSQRSLEILTHMDRTLAPQILGLLDEMKQSFQALEFREMMLVLRGESPLCLTVDEVLGVGPLTRQPLSGTPMTDRSRTFICGVQSWSKVDDLIMELDVPALRSYVERNAAT